MPTDLKPCPFCGGHAILCKESETHELGYEIKTAFVKCDCCGANTGAYYTNGVYGTTTTVQDVIKAWNRRVENELTKGEWICKWKSTFPQYEPDQYCCSNCGCIKTMEYRYCPNCGAKMKGETK